MHNMTRCDTPLDDRIDTELFALNQEATKLIPEWFQGLQIEQDRSLPVHFEQMWVAYFAAEIYGNADTALIAITHNRGRQARILERQMYEALKKAQYYVKNPAEARLEFLAVPFRDKAFWDQMQCDTNSARYAAVLQIIRAASIKFPDVAEYATSHSREKSLRDMVGPQNDATVNHEYAFHYRRLSQTPHGTVLGMEDVLDYRPDGNIGIKFDSWLDDPNFAVQNMTIYLITFLDLLSDVFALGRDEAVKSLEDRNNTIVARLHPKEYAEVHTES
jgi:hypothetical protein